MKLKLIAAVTFALILAQNKAEAQSFRGPSTCDEMTFWNYSTGMCEGQAMPGMPMSMLMIHGNGFIVQDAEEGPRAHNQLSSPNMLMADLGISIGQRNYLNLDVMLTAERWTYPDSGYPLLTQIGEENANGQPYLDSQHPHSSPLMGLTLSDTYTPGKTIHLKIFAAPRGEATDGPTAFMHRPSGEVNPDAPLGHHIGQDVGHITSSVIGAELRMYKTNLETSTFYGQEPEPSQVDLPTAAPNSWAVRITQQLSPEIHVMASAAYVKSPESHDPQVDHIWRYSASLYTDAKFENGWMFHDALIYGLVNFYDHSGALNSFLYEATYANDWHCFWGRAEELQRTPDELQIPTAQSASDRSTGRWTGLLTLGYTQTLMKTEDAKLQLGASVSKDFLPGEFQSAYGGNPLSAKLFLQLGGMKMIDL